MAKERMTEADVDMLESFMAMAIVGNVENFNGAPYIARLTDKLKEKNIPFKLGKIYNHGDAVTFPWSDGDVICHHGSYGHKLGQYEFMGDDFLTPEEASRDSVKGNIPLEDAVSRIEKAYKKYEDRQNARNSKK